jgi:hypothetical protein
MAQESGPTTGGQTASGETNGQAPIGTVEQIMERAPKDLVEEVLYIPEWECSVKVRSLTAAARARVRQRGVGFKGEEMQMAWAEMEIAQFKEGVREPKFSTDEVRKLHMRSGRGFQRVVDWLDEHSSMNKEELEQAREEFQDRDD